MSDAVDAFDAYTRKVVGWARADPRILGIALLGSGADRSRIDKWSDHDVLVLAAPNAVEELRGDLSWLPDGDRLAAVGREWHDGIKVLYLDGKIVEIGITDTAHLATFPIVAFNIVYDAGVLAAGLARATGRTQVRSITRGADAAAVFLVQLAVGVGRFRRGERLSGGHVVRSEAALTLIDLILERAGIPSPDPFDGWRRMERVHAQAASRLDELLREPIEDAARGLLDMAEELVAPGWTEWPSAAAVTTRRRLSAGSI